MIKPNITSETVKPEYETKFLKVFDLQYAPGKHYYDATRRSKEELVALKTEEEYKTLVADAVSCVVIAESPNEEPRLLLSWEFRYPTNHFVLGVPAGLIDAEDRNSAEPVKTAAMREIYEETGISVTLKDVTIVNPLLFSTPGMTDESNAIACVRVSSEQLGDLTREHAEGSELFEGFELLTKSEAKALILKGTDRFGNYLSVYTWIALAWFLMMGEQ